MSVGPLRVSHVTLIFPLFRYTTQIFRQEVEQQAGGRRQHLCVSFAVIEKQRRSLQEAPEALLGASGCPTPSDFYKPASFHQDFREKERPILASL